MLTQEFIDWWFSPWTYAVHARSWLPLDADWLGHRDGYRLWSVKAQVAPDLPRRFDPAWQVAVTTSGPELIAAARLFGGLVAVRLGEHGVLDQLAPSQRKWCVSIAATQPLQGCPGSMYAPDETIAVRGLLELSRRLEAGFPGMWSRLRLLLSPAISERVGVLLDAAPAAGAKLETSSTRAMRCWSLCRNQALATMGDMMDNTAGTKNASAFPAAKNIGRRPQSHASTADRLALTDSD